MNFSENLKRLLCANRLKQADLCRMTGIQTSLMSDYLGGKKSPTLGNAILIADAFHISLDMLVGKEPLPAPCDTRHSKVTAELLSAIVEMSELEQLFLLDIIKSFKQRFNRLFK